MRTEDERQSTLENELNCWLDHNPDAGDVSSFRAGFKAGEDFANYALTARAEAAERRAGELEGALNGIADDYMTSESHHPDHVLIPKAKFEQLAALLPATQAEGE